MVSVYCIFFVQLFQSTTDFVQKQIKNGCPKSENINKLTNASY